MPGGECWQGEEEFDGARNGNASQDLEGIADYHRTIPGIEEGDMAWRVPWGGNHFEGADAITFVQQERRLCLAYGIATAQGHLRLRRVQALIAGQETSVSLANRYLCVG